MVGPQRDEGKDDSVREIQHVRERTLCDRARLQEKKGKKSSGETQINKLKPIAKYSAGQKWINTMLTCILPTVLD